MTSFPLKYTAANVCQNTPVDRLLYCFPQLFKYGSKSSRAAKVKGNESCLHSRSWGEKVPGVQKLHGTKILGLFTPWENVPQKGSSTGAKVLSVDFSHPGTKVQRNENSTYPQ